MVEEEFRIIVVVMALPSGWLPIVTVFIGIVPDCLAVRAGSFKSADVMLVGDHVAQKERECEVHLLLGTVVP